MWPARYFCNRFFATRYWVKASSSGGGGGGGSSTGTGSEEFQEIPQTPGGVHIKGN